MTGGRECRVGRLKAGRGGVGWGGSIPGTTPRELIPYHTTNTCVRLESGCHARALTHTHTNGGGRCSRPRRRAEESAETSSECFFFGRLRLSSLAQVITLLLFARTIPYWTVYRAVQKYQTISWGKRTKHTAEAQFKKHKLALVLRNSSSFVFAEPDSVVILWVSNRGCGLSDGMRCSPNQVVPQDVLVRVRYCKNDVASMTDTNAKTVLFFFLPMKATCLTPSEPVMLSAFSLCYELQNTFLENGAPCVKSSDCTPKEHSTAALQREQCAMQKKRTDLLVLP